MNSTLHRACFWVTVPESRKTVVRFVTGLSDSCSIHEIMNDCHLQKLFLTSKDKEKDARNRRECRAIVFLK